MNPLEAKQFKRWLNDNGAIMIAFVELGSFIVLIRSTDGRQFFGVGESEGDFEEAVREAQHSFDAGIIRQAHRAARVVGRA